MAEKRENQAEMSFYQAPEKEPVSKDSRIRMQRDENRALTERRWN